MRKTIVMLAVLALAVMAAAPSRAMTSVSHERPDGRVLTVHTGGDESECSVHGSRLVCEDGPGFAMASLENGCERAGRGGRCTVGREDPDLTVSTQGSSGVDVECETGGKKGYVYTVDDGDGSGSCGQNHDVGGAVNGGTCTKNSSECTSVDCDHGCSNSTKGCGCHLKSKPKTS